MRGRSFRLNWAFLFILAVALLFAAPPALWAGETFLGGLDGSTVVELAALVAADAPKEATPPEACPHDCHPDVYCRSYAEGYYCALETKRELVVCPVTETAAVASAAMRSAVEHRRLFCFSTTGDREEIARRFGPGIHVFRPVAGQLILASEAKAAGPTIAAPATLDDGETFGGCAGGACRRR